MSANHRFPSGRMLVSALALFSLSTWVAAAPKAYVGNAKDNTVSVIDLAANKVVATVPVAAGPHGIVIAPDGRWVYVCNDGSTTVSVLDTRTDKVVRTIEVGKSPHGDRLTPDGKILVVAVNGEDRVDFVDTASQSVVATAAVGKPHTVGITPDGKFAYVASQAPGNFALTVIDVATHTVLRAIPLDKSPRDLEFGQDGLLYFTQANVDGVKVLDPASNRIVAEIPTGPSPHIANFFPNAKQGAVVVQGQSELDLFDPKSDKVTGRISVGKQPHWVTVSADGSTAYVTNEGSNDVSVIDMATGRTKQNIAVGNGPRKIAIQ